MRGELRSLGSHSLARRVPASLWMVIAFYLLAHVLPVTEIFGQWMFGWQASISTLEGAVITLWDGKDDWLFVFGWLPNPFLWFGVACLVMGRQRNARLAGVAAGLAGLAATVCASLWFFNMDKNDVLWMGYYVWLASMLLLSGLGFWTAVRARPGPLMEKRSAARKPTPGSCQKLERAAEQSHDAK